MPKVLRGRGADGQHFRGRVFLGCDSAPITLMVHSSSARLHVAVLIETTLLYMCAREQVGSLRRPLPGIKESAADGNLAECFVMCSSARVPHTSH